MKVGKEMRIMRRVGAARMARWGKPLPGFTLIEIMAGLTVLLIAMAGLVPLFLAGFQQSSAVRYKSTANNIAREKMEEIRQLDYREIVDAAFLSDEFGATEDVRGVTYDISYVVNVLDETDPAQRLKEVTVEVGWTGEPTISPARFSTLFHQQYLGPRIARMEVDDLYLYADPAGTPFDCLVNGSTPSLRCYIAEADWGLVVDHLNEAGMAAKDGVYMRLYLVNDSGVSTPVGNAAADYKIDDAYVDWDVVDGKVAYVYFEYPLDTSAISDGYWELRAWAFNAYDEPGNKWSLRVRVESGAPDAPKPPNPSLTTIGATPYGDDTIVLNWLAPDAEDIDHYCIKRISRVYNEGVGWGLWKTDWTVVASDVPKGATSYTDTGDPALAKEPYVVTTGQLKQYQYLIYAVDEDELSGAIAYTDYVLLPSGAELPEETTTTTEPDPNIEYTVTIENTTGKTYTVTITSSDGTQDVEPISIAKDSTGSFSGLVAGHYAVVASTPSVKTDIVGSFTLPLPDPELSVLMILDGGLDWN